MDELESEIFQSAHSLLTHIAFRRRYVDDVLCMWTGPIEKVSELRQFISGLTLSIKFTVAIGGPTIDFLILSISIISSGEFTFGVYRKPNTTDTFKSQALVYM